MQFPGEQQVISGHMSDWRLNQAWTNSLQTQKVSKLPLYRLSAGGYVCTSLSSTTRAESYCLRIIRAQFWCREAVITMCQLGMLKALAVPACAALCGQRCCRNVCSAHLLCRVVQEGSWAAAGVGRGSCATETVGENSYIPLWDSRPAQAAERGPAQPPHRLARCSLAV